MCKCVWCAFQCLSESIEIDVYFIVAVGYEKYIGSVIVVIVIISLLLLLLLHLKTVSAI